MGGVYGLIDQTRTIERITMALHLGAMIAARIAPQTIGLGLFEAIPAADIMAVVDLGVDSDGDGISGQANTLWSAEHVMPMLGRFDLNAGSPALREQNASAFAGDIGISPPIFAAAFGDCTALQADCRPAAQGGGGGARRMRRMGLHWIW
jgi:CxxC motif-containing protein (DUF1111 family)